MKPHGATGPGFSCDNVSILHAGTACRKCPLNAICSDSATNPALPRYLARITQHPRPLRRGEHLFRQGDRLNALYVVRSGAIKQYFTSHDGNEQVINFNYPGEVLSLDSIDNRLYNTSAIALDTTSVCSLSYDKVNALCSQKPEFHNQFIRAMARELVNDQNMLLLLGQRQAEERFATFLLQTSNRCGSNGNYQLDFLLTMTRHDIANYLGLADETVSRLISRFAEEEIVRVKGRHIEILDIDCLFNLANVWQNQFGKVMN